MLRISPGPTTPTLASMKFGTEGQFEIECYRDYEPDEKNRVFGRMCLLVGGNALGNIEEFSCMLNVTGY